MRVIAAILATGILAPSLPARATDAESAGDSNIKALVSVATAAAGALIGFLIGAALDTRHTTIYRAP